MATAVHSTVAPEDGAHHRTRRAVEAHIEWLIALLDALDDDPDLEDTHDAEAVDEDGSDTGPSDNGIADLGGAAEQFFGFGFIRGNVEMTCNMPGGDVIGADEGRGGVR